jgi:serine/threonine protein kinase
MRGSSMFGPLLLFSTAYAVRAKNVFPKSPQTQLLMKSVGVAGQELPWRHAKPSDPSFHSYLEAYQRSNSLPPLDNLARECRPIVKRMLDPNPKTRAKTEEILKDEWFESIEIVDTKPPGINA